MQHHHRIKFEKKQQHYQQQCTLCEPQYKLQPTFLNKALYHKYTEVHNFKDYFHLSSILTKSNNHIHIKYKEQLILDTEKELMRRTYNVKQSITRVKCFTEHYKYHVSVPIMHLEGISQMLERYHQKRLKIYYNKIKQQLNITVNITKTEISEESGNTTIEPLGCNCILCEITKTQQNNNQVAMSIGSRNLSKELIKSESKALEEVVEQITNLKDQQHRYVEHFNDFPVNVKMSETGRQFEQFLKSLSKKNQLYKSEKFATGGGVNRKQKEIIIKTVKNNIKKIVPQQQHEGNHNPPQEYRSTDNLKNLKGSNNFKVRQYFNDHPPTFRDMIREKLNFRSVKQDTLALVSPTVNSKLIKFTTTLANFKRDIAYKSTKMVNLLADKESIIKPPNQFLNVYARKMHTQARSSVEKKKTKILSLQGLKKHSSAKKLLPAPKQKSNSARKLRFVSLMQQKPKKTPPSSNLRQKKI